MNKQEFNGKTLDEALSAAARALGTDVTSLSYNILPQSSGGLFSKLFQRGVRLEAWIDSSNDVQAAAREALRQARSGSQDHNKKSDADGSTPARTQQKQRHRDTEQPGARRDAKNGRGPKRSGSAHRENSDRPARQSRENLRPIPRSSESAQSPTQIHSDTNEQSQRPRYALTSPESKSLLNELAREFVRGFDPEQTSIEIETNFLNDEEVEVFVNSPTLEGFLTRTDRLSCAFEHLFKRIAQRKFGDISGRVFLNAGHAKNHREEKLQQMALDVAQKVKETGKTITLGSKSSQERRIIHLALENMEGIATKSVGVGDNRRLIVYSTNRQHRTERRGRRNHSEHTRQAASRQFTDASGQTTGDDLAQESATQGPDGTSAPRRNRRRGRRGNNRNSSRTGRAEQHLEQPIPVDRAPRFSENDNEG